MKANSKAQFIYGLRQAMPIVLGYIPVGFALGVIASGVGLSMDQVGMMSLLVYAGSAQFIGVNMISTGAHPVAIVMTTFLVNLRHLLFSASLSPYFKNIKAEWIPLISFFITDESFAVSITDAQQREELTHHYYLGLYITAYLCWVLSTMVGTVLGSLIPDTKVLGFDFALPGMFLALLCMQLKDIKFVVIAIISGVLSLIFLVTLPENWNVLLGTVIAAGLGVLTDK